MFRRDRSLGALVAVLGVAMLAATLELVHLNGVVATNHTELRDQRSVITQLAGAVGAAQQDASAQRRLVQALQRQVRRLGGQPLTETPTGRTLPGTPAPAAGSPVVTPAPTRRPSPPPSSPPSPRPTPSPTPRPSLTPTPASSLCVSTAICLPIGGH